jgi:hypothetical protein
MCNDILCYPGSMSKPACLIFVSRVLDELKECRQTTEPTFMWTILISAAMAHDSYEFLTVLQEHGTPFQICYTMYCLPNEAW